MRKQLSMFESTRRLHGGSIGLKRRKTKRPLDTKKPIHIVLRSDRVKSNDRLNLLKHQPNIERIIRKWAAKFRISVYEKAIVSNHIHLLIRGKTKKEIQDFFRTIAALIARYVTGARKGRPFGKFWTYILFSRLLGSWKREFEIVRKYIVRNTLAALGIIKLQPRKSTAPS